MKNTAAVDNYWSAFFGLGVAQLNAPGVHVVRHHDLDPYNGAWIFDRSQTRIISVPAAMLAGVQQTAAAGPLPHIAQRDDWSRIFGAVVIKVIGPAHDGFVGGRITAASPHKVGVVGADDRFQLDALEKCCTSQ